jgi:hypothetical protein
MSYTIHKKREHELLIELKREREREHLRHWGVEEATLTKGLVNVQKHLHPHPPFGPLPLFITSTNSSTCFRGLLLFLGLGV